MQRSLPSQQQQLHLSSTRVRSISMLSGRKAGRGSRYPDVNLAINNQLFSGTLIWNYSGHGGYRRLAEEVVLDQDIINTFNNADKLPLFITATCDVAPYDNPLISSIGENLLLREKTGAIALMTTTRLVFAFSNRVMNKNYMETAAAVSSLTAATCPWEKLYGGPKILPIPFPAM